MFNGVCFTYGFIYSFSLTRSSTLSIKDKLVLPTFAAFEKHSLFLYWNYLTRTDTDSSFR